MTVIIFVKVTLMVTAIVIIIIMVTVIELRMQCVILKKTLKSKFDEITIFKIMSHEIK